MLKQLFSDSPDISMTRLLSFAFGCVAIGIGVASIVRWWYVGGDLTQPAIVVGSFLTASAGLKINQNVINGNEPKQ